MKSLFFLILSWTIFWNVSSGQNVFSLDDCIDYALENNPDVRSVAMDKDLANIAEKYAKYLRLPSLNGSSGYSLSYGRRVDPTTNDFIQQRFSNQSISLNTGMTLYSGGSINNQIKKATINAQFQEMLNRDVKAEISYFVSEAFYNVLIAYERDELNQSNLENGQLSMDRIKTQVDAGALPETALMESQAQVAQLEYLKVQSSNAIQTSLESLKQIMNWQENEELVIDNTELEIEPLYAGFEKQYTVLQNSLLDNNPAIQTVEKQVNLAEIDVELAKAQRLPTLSIGGSMNTNYSSAAQEVSATGQFQPTQAIPVLINGEESTLSTFEPVLNYANKTYGAQLNDNIGYGVGLQLSIPIFNNMSAKSNIIQSEIALEKQRLNQEKNKIDLSAQLKSALLDLENTWRNYMASQKLNVFNKTVFENMEIKNQAGAASNLELDLARNNYINSASDIINNKYLLAMKMQQINFLTGKGIREF